MRILHVIFTLCIACLEIACYEDKGNYDYTDKLEITVSGIQEAYNRIVGDTISLKPQITPANTTVFGVLSRSTVGLTTWTLSLLNRTWITRSV
jgi:hypothetical protein